MIIANRFKGMNTKKKKGKEAGTRDEGYRILRQLAFLPQHQRSNWREERRWLMSKASKGGLA
jgi:hypothetical protein